MKKVIIIILVVIAVILSGGYIYVKHLENAPLPNYNQTVMLKGLHHEVKIIRDKWGMPHIYAQDLDDLYMTLGYVMAQDRLWHMDLLRRVTEGRLSEIFGKDFVETDLLLRALRIPWKSKILYRQLPDSLKQYLNDFCSGVNQYIKFHKDRLPVEFRILGYKPELWKPINTLNLIGFMAWDLGMGWRGDITLWELKQKVDSLRFKQAVPEFKHDQFIYNYHLSGEPQINISEAIDKIRQLGIVTFTASNNWAVGPQKSVYGKPILANDMHLGFGIPGIWYQVHLIVPGKLDVTGVTIPGAPGVVAGHNKHIAWGMTNVMMDDMDFYIEKVNRDTTEYEVDGKWHKFKIIKERIAVKGGDTITKVLRFTYRGPVISGLKGIKSAVISAAWEGYDTLSNEYLGVQQLNFASNWNDFVNALKHFRSVAQNFVYADDKGNFGIHMGAGIPLRKRPGYLPYEGDTSLYDWKGYVPFDQLPYEYNPKCGYVASANNKSAPNYPYYISQYFYQDYRYARIVEMLKSKPKLSVADFEKIQADWKSKLVEKSLPRILAEINKIKTNDQLVKKAIKYMDSWDGVMRGNQVAPLLFEEFYYQFLRTVMEDEVGWKLFRDYVGNKIFANTMFINVLFDKHSPWLDNVKTKRIETYDYDVQQAFISALDTLKKELGSNIDEWEYGRIHTLVLEHPLGKVKLLNWLFDFNRGPFHVGGSSHTVCPYTYNLNHRYHVTAGASQRHIFIPGDWDKGMMIIPTGESGLPGDEFYCNQTSMYLHGQYRPDAFSDSAVEAVKKYERVFLPKK